MDGPTDKPAWDHTEDYVACDGQKHGCPGSDTKLHCRQEDTGSRYSEAASTLFLPAQNISVDHHFKHKLKSLLQEMVNLL